MKADRITTDALSRPSTGSRGSNRAGSFLALGAFLLADPLAAQLLNHGTRIFVAEDALVTVSGDLENDVGGSIDLQGSLVLGGDFANEGTFSAGMSGEVWCNGTGDQFISGMEDAPVSVLTLAGPGRVVLNASLQIRNELWFEGGIMDLGAHDLILLPGSRMMGEPSATSMVATTGTGTLTLPVDGPGVYHFPIGTLSGGPEYTPVSIELNEILAEDDAALSARVGDDASAVNPSLHHYIDRVWHVTASPALQVFDSTATFHWAASDEIGDPGQLFGAQFADARFHLLEPANARIRQFTGRVERFGVFTAGEARAFEDDVLAEAHPPNLQLPPGAEDGGFGVVDLAAAYGDLPGFTFRLGSVSDERLFSRLEIVDGRLEVVLEEGVAGESTVRILATNEYGITSEVVLHVTRQPKPQPLDGHLNQLTGLFEETFLLENISSVRPLHIVDLALADLPSSATVFRAWLSGREAPLSLETTDDGASVHVSELLMPGQTAQLRVEYRSSTRRAPEGRTVRYGTPGFYTEATADGRWLRRDPFGWFCPFGAHWAYHRGLGWTYRHGEDSGSLQLYLPDHGWIWTSDTAYPYLYDYASGSWLYYLTSSRNPALFYDFATEAWRKL